jgi:hypothetical protein
MCAVDHESAAKRVFFSHASSASSAAPIVDGWRVWMISARMRVVCTSAREHKHRREQAK